MVLHSSFEARTWRGLGVVSRCSDRLSCVVRVGSSRGWPVQKWDCSRDSADRPSWLPGRETFGIPRECRAKAGGAAFGEVVAILVCPMTPPIQQYRCRASLDPRFYSDPLRSMVNSESINLKR